MIKTYFFFLSVDTWNNLGQGLDSTARFILGNLYLYYI